MEANNNAALRDALEQVKNAHHTDDESEWFDIEADDGTGRPLICVVENALESPPRQCDVGTADEQYKRHCAYCKKNKDFACAPVMCRKCYADWSQTPYVEEDSDGGK